MIRHTKWSEKAAVSIPSYHLFSPSAELPIFLHLRPLWLEVHLSGMSAHALVHTCTRTRKHTRAHTHTHMQAHTHENTHMRSCTHVTHALAHPSAVLRRKGKGHPRADGGLGRGQVGEEQLQEALTKSVTCCILGAAGPQRSRMLATLYKDERCAQLPTFPFLEKVYLERILRPGDVSSLPFHPFPFFSMSLFVHERIPTSSRFSGNDTFFPASPPWVGAPAPRCPPRTTSFFLLLPYILLLLHFPLLLLRFLLLLLVLLRPLPFLLSLCPPLFFVQLYTSS